MGWAPYVPVTERRRQAEKEMAKLSKKGDQTSPVVIEGRKIAATFWGKAWCDNLEAYSDFENRLPRGRTYVRNGSVVDLKITAGNIVARVSGSSLYTVKINIKPLSVTKWKTITRECAGRIDSLVELLTGKLSNAVMEIITRKGEGLFPIPKEISMECSCPDYATLCKHVAATFYGIGARLDHEPNLLFLLRNVDQGDLIKDAGTGIRVDPSVTDRDALDEANLSGIFGIDLVTPKKSDLITPAKKATTKKKPEPKKKTLPQKKPASKGMTKGVRRPAKVVPKKQFPKK
jgi:uncharacterized Zn finger protein